MEGLLKKTCFLWILITVFLVFFINVETVEAAEQYTLMGAYNEDGLRDGAINCTFWREQESTTTFELDGTYLANATYNGTVFHFDIGYNESRVCYVYGNETIYVMKPYDPYANYYFDLVDYAGLDWGYLESLVNLNGTDRVCERQTIDIINDIPFTFSWARTYKMRLICDRGEYVYGSYVAGATYSFTLAVTSDMFPVNRTDIGDLSVTVNRPNASWIQSTYLDVGSLTNWVHFGFYEAGNQTAFHTYNTTSNSVVYNWNEGVSTIDYYVIVTVNHQNLGTKYWTFTCPSPVTIQENPFSALSLLGEFPFDATQLPAVLILSVIAMSFSWFNAPLGIVITILVAFVLVWIDWLAVGWGWLATAGSIGMILAIAMMKERTRV